MTNQEAIEHIKNIKIYSWQDGYTDEAREALDMAISALQAQEETVRCKDCKYSIDFYGPGECYCCRLNWELDWTRDWNFYCGAAERRKDENQSKRFC